MVVFALTLIRHGETCANKDNIIQGQMDVPLSKTGLAQVDLLGDRLQNQRYTHVFASDLVRAQQTVNTIIGKSLFVKCAVISDERLRERKFGEVEGKSISELKKLAKLANQTPPNYTPSGAETVHQVHNRAVLFFRELCQQLLQKNGSNHSEKTDDDDDDETESEDGVLDAPKRRRPNITGDDTVAEDETRAKTETQPMKTHASNGGAVAPHVDHRPSSIRSSLETNRREDVEPKSLPPPPPAQLCVYVPSKRSRRQKNGNPKAPLPVVVTPRPTAYTRMDIDCPNVTLSPLGEHKFLNVSDRKASVDSLNDDIAGPDVRPSANVLVVSHGGLLREMIRHFVEDLGCAVPGGKGQALRLSPNTGLSKFTVSVDETGEDPEVICLLIHDKDHLVEGQMATVDGTAL